MNVTARRTMSTGVVKHKMYFTESASISAEKSIIIENMIYNKKSFQKLKYRITIPGLGLASPAHRIVSLRPSKYAKSLLKLKI